MTIRLQCDPTTGKKNIVITLKSDEDALPHEHEQLHRSLVDKVVEGGLAKADEIGDLIVEREEESKQNESPTTAAPQDERQAQGNTQG